MKLIKRIKKGFTLVELVVVIAIIAILSGVSVAVYVGITDNARKSALTSEARSFGTVIRAAVLAEPEGKEVEVGANKYIVTWSTTEGIVMDNDNDSTTELPDEEKAILLKLYHDLEGNDFPKANAVSTELPKNGKVDKVTFQENDYTVVYSFVDGSTK